MEYEFDADIKSTKRLKYITIPNDIRKRIRTKMVHVTISEKR